MECNKVKKEPLIWADKIQITRPGSPASLGRISVPVQQQKRQELYTKGE